MQNVYTKYQVVGDVSEASLVTYLTYQDAVAAAKKLAWKQENVSIVEIKETYSVITRIDPDHIFTVIKR